MEAVVDAHGHEHVTAQHASTLELTSDGFLTPADFDSAFVAACRDADTTITATFEAGDHTETVRGRGHPDLGFANDRSLVCRTSEYVDDRTVMVAADAAAADLDRAFVAALTGGADLRAVFRVE